MNGTDLLCRALYGREPKPKDYMGGADAKMLHDAAEVVKAARHIHHWHDSGKEGMVVSSECVRDLWTALPDEG